MAALKVIVGSVGGRVLLTPDGALTHESVEDLRRAFAQAAEGQDADVLLDMHEVALMDSAALDTILDLHDSMERRRRTLRLFGLNEVCRDIMAATRLQATLHVYTDLAKATIGGRAT